MPGEQLPARVDHRAQRLRDAQDDAAHQRAPEIAEAADDHRLEAEDQAPGARWTGRNWRACARNTPARATTASDSAIARPNRCLLSSPSGDAISRSSEVARNARPSSRAVEHELQRRDDDDRSREHQQRHANRAPRRAATFQLAVSIKAPASSLRLSAVKILQQAVLDDNREPEGHQQAAAGYPSRACG